MDTVTVAELKSRLSHYLREVRAGRSFTVTSRDIPVAMLGPWDPANLDDLDVIEADRDAVSLFEPMLEPAPGVPDGAELIRRDREASDARLDPVRRDARGRRGRGAADGGGT